MNEQEKQIVKSALKDQLAPMQLEALDTVRWLYYGARGGGRTHLLCTAALLEVAEGRGTWVVDHTPWSEPMESYVVNMLFSIASDAGMKIKISHRRRGAIYVELDHEEYRLKPD